jgi:hypothetical protein
MPRIIPQALLTTCILVFSGCGDDSGKRVPAKGRVVYKSLPVGNKTLNLVFVADTPADSFNHSLPLDGQGNFNGEVPRLGKYKVTVVESLSVMEGMDKPSTTGPKVPEKYKAAATSDITLEIGKSGYTGDIELKD